MTIETEKERENNALYSSSEYKSIPGSVNFTRIELEECDATIKFRQRTLP
jgi:hypothetical protein